MYYHPSQRITEQEECEALDTCTPETIAHACIYGLAINAFQLYGMDYDVYTLIDQGWGAFRPYEDIHFKGSMTEPKFLRLLTGNANFDPDSLVPVSRADLRQPGPLDDSDDDDSDDDDGDY